jgi:hypothetical protein
MPTKLLCPKCHGQRTVSCSPVVALVAGASPGSWSVSAGNAMEAANVGVTFAAVQQKLNPRHCNDGPLSSTPPDESYVGPGHRLLRRTYRLLRRT